MKTFTFHSNIRIYSFLILLTFALAGCNGDGDNGGGDNPANCIISDLTVAVGDCSCVDAYNITVDFEVDDPSSQFFELQTRGGVSIGYYKISDLPITIDKFETSGLNDDFLKVCIDDDPDCCEEIEFFPPDCSDACGVMELVVETGECGPDGNYELFLNFDTENATDDNFDMFVRGDVLIGYFSLDELPLSIDSFEPSGNDYDFIKVCINDNPDCCAVIEFLPPECAGEGGDCEILEVNVEVGECTSLETYELYLDFEVINPSNELYDLYVRNSELLGTYSIDELPLMIPEFPFSGNDYDFIKICINDNPDCCYEWEFMPPECSVGDCALFDLVVDTGGCSQQGIYELALNFEYIDAGNEFFDVYVRNGVLLGTYPLSELPLDIDEFEWSGEDYDFIKVCINDHPDCCQEIEFMPPDCAWAACEIYDLTVEIGECTSESTYNLVLDFEVSNPGNEFFEVFVRQDELIGYYNLDEDRPLELIDFEMSGNDYDFIRVCINDVPDCCVAIEYMPPEC